MSKLDDILIALTYGTLSAVLPGARNPDHTEIRPTEAKQQIKGLFLELIGEDESEPTSSTGPSYARNRNWFRYELRQKVQEL